VNEALHEALSTFAQMHRELRGDKGSQSKLKTNVKGFKCVFDYSSQTNRRIYEWGKRYSTEKTSKEYP
jgi:hypothetical protein